MDGNLTTRTGGTLHCFRNTNTDDNLTERMLETSRCNLYSFSKSIVLGALQHMSRSTMQLRGNQAHPPRRRHPSHHRHFLPSKDLNTGSDSRFLCSAFYRILAEQFNLCGLPRPKLKAHDHSTPGSIEPQERARRIPTTRFKYHGTEYPAYNRTSAAIGQTRRGFCSRNCRLSPNKPADKGSLASTTDGTGDLLV